MRTAIGAPEPRTVTNLLAGLDHDLRTGRSTGFAPTPTGFHALDDALGGGLRRGDLNIFAGPPGVGKTVLALQAARQVAEAGFPAIVVCYEHDETSLLLRLLAQATSESDPRGRLISTLTNRLRDGAAEHHGIAEILAREPALKDAFESLDAIGDRLVLLAASARDTGMPEIDAAVGHAVTRFATPPVLIVDYLQKVPTDDRDAEARSRRVVEGLKDLAMHHDVAVVATASLTAGGLAARRLRLTHLDDTSAIAFEADVVVLLNDKTDAVAKAHLAYGGEASKDYANWVIWSLAKNRSGPNLVDLEFRKDFTHFRYDPKGRQVSERLADDRLLGDAG